ncbi:MAG: alpha/beta hydrolase [Oscillospiraceae bacterium]|nr:alpha/beta hydrolase [Oscillospiraceae bacterium]
MTINVNGVNLYYKVSGQGAPVILLHGNGEDHTIFRILIKKLSADYTVYAIDSRGHGRSSKVRHLNYIDKMNDVAEFIKELGIKKPILYGFSDGGIIGLLLAINHPDILDKLIISGANTYPDGLKPFPLFLIKASYFFTRSNKLKLMLTQPNISDAELETIVTPTLVLAGHRDFIKEEHTLNIAKNIPGSELRILKGESHSSYVVNSGKIYDIIMTFIRE